MSDDGNPAAVDETINALLTRNAELEAALQEAQERAHSRLLNAELKAEALKNGMIDLDGLKLIDTESVVANAVGEFEGVSDLISSLRRDKPWLFVPANSSSTATVPKSSTIQNKNATEMTLAEWRAARADLLRRR